MSKSPKEMYAVPEWMRQYLPLFQNTGGNDVEELLHDEDTNMFANSIRYMLIVSARSQFSLLMGMHSQGIALASSEAEKGAEPVAKVDTVGVCWYADNGVPRKPAVGTELYSAPPAPVSVPDEVLKRLLPDAEKAEFWFEHDGKILFEGMKFNNAVLKACRAAMLQVSEPVTTAYKLPEETGSSLQLRNLIRQRHAEWSQATFGDVGPVGPLKHLSKEALEAAEEPDDLSEWADMQFLLWDAQRRAGISDGEITAAMEEKLNVNMARQWPEPKDGEPRMHIKAAPQQE